MSLDPSSLRYDNAKRDESQRHQCRKDNNGEPHRYLRHGFLLKSNRSEN
jgi:hypothetical protein